MFNINFYIKSKFSFGKKKISSSEEICNVKMKKRKRTRCKIIEQLASKFILSFHLISVNSVDERYNKTAQF